MYKNYLFDKKNYNLSQKFLFNNKCKFDIIWQVNSFMTLIFHVFNSIFDLSKTLS